MKTVVGRMVLVVLLVVLGSALVFWGCSKKSPTASTTSGGKLYIASYPDSATVTLDGAQQTGKTPLTLQNVSAAQHVVICTKGNFSAVDTVVVHTGRPTPDTAFCWIPGKVAITSQPTNGFVRFQYDTTTIGGGPTGYVYRLLSDTYQVTCSTSTAGYFKAVDTFRIWADSTAKNYVLPPMADSTVVYARDSTDTTIWYRNGPFNKVDIVEVAIFFAHNPPVDILLKYQIYIEGNLAGSGSGIVPSTWPMVVISWTAGGHCLPFGNYTHPSSWGVMPHDFPLSNPSWRINSILGVPAEPGRLRATIRPIVSHRRY